ncbi:MAG TPA: MFS transporter, partial [Candidatus Dormibacteraeota bacterium]|nr:MFS transporter [Candidatus Dormibacteraeota bacterium]
HKAVWDFEGIYATSRHVPRVRFAGIIHTGQIGVAPSTALLAKWNRRERGRTGSPQFRAGSWLAALVRWVTRRLRPDRRPPFEEVTSMSDVRALDGRYVRTDIPARMDRLPWSRWHWTIVVALGITWVLDGLEVTIVGSLGPRLEQANTLRLTASQVGLTATTYLIGAIVGAFVFGFLTDRLGRKKLFLVTLGWYTFFTVLSALSVNFLMFATFRALTGMGIGGEYSAINSAIDELIPARRRGWTDLSINSSWWLGTMFGSAVSLLFLDERLFPANLGWRLCFALGAIIALVVLWIRHTVPESPRWLMTHGRVREAARTVSEIERIVEGQTGRPLPPPSGVTVTIDTERAHGSLHIFSDVVSSMVHRYPRRTVLSLSLMVTQAFLYNAIFFTEALVLSTYFGVPAGRVGLYIIPFALGNLIGPWVLGHAFDVLGRRPMIAGTYILSGLLLAGTALLFSRGALSATTITICWSITFFFASAGASAGYLTASEVFPMEVRANAIAVAYAASEVAGAIAPAIFGVIIATHSVANLSAAYLLGAGLMIVGGLVEVVLGVDAEGKALEAVAAPLSAHEVEVPRMEPLT